MVRIGNDTFALHFICTGYRVKWVGVHGCCHSPFLVNGWGTRYIGRRPIEPHSLHGCKSTLCMVMMVRARSKDNVLKSQAVLEIFQCFCFKVISEIVQCFCFKEVMEIVQSFLFIKLKAFVLDKGPFIEIPMVSFSLWA